MRKGLESIQSLRLLNSLRKQGKKHAVWARVAELVARPARKRVEVTLKKLSRVSKKGETVIIPGKLLATGVLGHALHVACFKASKQAALLVHKAGGKVMTISALMKVNPAGSKTRIVV